MCRTLQLANSRPKRTAPAPDGARNLAHDGEDAFVRQKAARSLGRLRAFGAEPTLRQMLESETDARAAEAIREALAAIDSSRDAEL